MKALCSGSVPQTWPDARIFSCPKKIKILTELWNVAVINPADILLILFVCFFSLSLFGHWSIGDFFFFKELLRSNTFPDLLLDILSLDGCTVVSEMRNCGCQGVVVLDFSHCTNVYLHGSSRWRSFFFFFAGEIDRCLKKVAEGVEQFEDIWQKVSVRSRLGILPTPLNIQRVTRSARERF